ncbi:transcription factor TGA9-like isoform X3 [Zingiber officinale]|uniref:transcription factor TGA9-like isoform X3 n=1 Tax=Zingiber officinale TaxID=94328 RepID=UPI001C4A8A6B|nr:transcription factor TGA9-like isoform X3 [Zingiber officinale]
MANNQNHRASATAHLAAPGPSSQAIARFFDDEGGGGSYFGELEEALVQLRESSSAGDRNCAATLEIFPSWPTRVRPFVGFEKKIETCRSSSDSAAAGSGGAAFMAAATAGTTTSESSRPSSLDKKNNMTGSMTGKGGKKLDAKTLRRLAQNREAAKKSRLRKKAYVQQLESSRIRLQQLEQELQRAKSQGLMVGVGGSANGAVSSVWCRSCHVRRGIRPVAGRQLQAHRRPPRRPPFSPPRRQPQHHPRRLHRQLRPPLPPQSHHRQLRRLPPSQRRLDDSGRALLPLDRRIQALRPPQGPHPSAGPIDGAATGGDVQSQAVVAPGGGGAVAGPPPAPLLPHRHRRRRRRLSQHGHLHRRRRKLHEPDGRCARQAH